MLKLYTNRELSEKLGINLAKWKRWSREFLPPDPLGGMQSGFARQYYFNDAFTVMLGGHLVGELNFSVYEARRVIEELRDWLTAYGFYQEPVNESNKQSSESRAALYKIFIRMDGGAAKQIQFTYTIRGVISNTPVEINGVRLREERYAETIIGEENSTSMDGEEPFEKVLNITALYRNFIGKLGYTLKKDSLHIHAKKEKPISKNKTY